jgi:hypothetical protein
MMIHPGQQERKAHHFAAVRRRPMLYTPSRVFVARSRSRGGSLGMQQQLKQGAFSPPAYSKLICRSDGPRVVWVSFTRVGSPSCVM